VRLGIGKILSLLKTPKTPLLGWFHADFLHKASLLGYSTRMLHCNGDKQIRKLLSHSIPLRQEILYSFSKNTPFTPYTHPNASGSLIGEEPETEDF